MIEDLNLDRGAGHISAECKNEGIMEMEKRGKEK
jgi:hypothetical protein